MVGGSGERQTLRIVAKYADACNLFGSIETVKRKLTILKEHCTSVGRDYGSILKTKLGIIVIESHREMAREKIQQLSRGMSEEQKMFFVNEYTLYGTPEDVLRQIGSFEEAGIQYIIVNLDPSRELEALDVFKENVIRKIS